MPRYVLVKDDSHHYRSLSWLFETKPPEARDLIQVHFETL